MLVCGVYNVDSKCLLVIKKSSYVMYCVQPMWTTNIVAVMKHFQDKYITSYIKHYIANKEFCLPSKTQQKKITKKFTFLKLNTSPSKRTHQK